MINGGIFTINDLIKAYFNNDTQYLYDRINHYSGKFNTIMSAFSESIKSSNEVSQSEFLSILDSVVHELVINKQLGIIVANDANNQRPIWSSGASVVVGEIGNNLSVATNSDQKIRNTALSALESEIKYLLDGNNRIISRLAALDYLKSKVNPAKKTYYNGISTTVLLEEIDSLHEKEIAKYDDVDLSDVISRDKGLAQSIQTVVPLQQSKINA